MPSTWEIEYRGTLADTAPGGDKRTLAAWGLAGIPELTTLNLARGNLTLAVDGTTSFLADLPWAYRDKIVVWRDGARYWQGWLTREPRSAAPEADSIAMVFGDPYWLLEQTSMTDPKVANPVIGPVTFTSAIGDVTLPAVQTIDWVEPGGNVTFAWRAQSAYTVQGQIRRALYAATRGGAALTLGSIGIDAPAATQQTKGATALSYLQAAVTFEPLSVGWWDYSGATPALHVQPRSALAAVSYALSGNPLGVSCEPLHEIQARAVRIRWAYTASDGSAMEHIEQAGDNTLPIGPNVLVLDASVADLSALIQALNYGIAARIYAALAPLAYAGSVSLVDDLSALATARPGAAINLTGGRAEWATMAGVVQSVSLSVVAEAESLTVSWGAPSHLGLSDWLELRDLGGAGAEHATYDPTPSRPSTIDPATYEERLGLPTGTPTGGLEYQSRGGVCTLIGWSEFGTPSSPPKKYRTATWAGGISCVKHLANGTVRASNSLTGSGSYTWTSASTRSRNQTATAVQVSDNLGDSTTTYVFTDTSIVHAPPTIAGSAIGAISSTDTFLDAAAFGATWPAVAQSTTTLTQQVNVLAPEPGNSYYTAGSGVATNTLSAEDTEEDAYLRCLDANPWPTYADGPHAGEEQWGSSATAIYQERDVGFSFMRTVLRYRATITNLGPWVSWRLVVRLERRALATGTTEEWGEWESAGSREHVVSGDLTGTGTIPNTEVEAQRGYVLRVAGYDILPL